MAFPYPEEAVNKVFARSKEYEAIAEGTGNPFWKARMDHAMAYLYMGLLMNKESLEYLKKAEKEWKKEDFKLGLAELKYLEGRLLIGNSDQKQRIEEIFQEALSMAKQGGFKKLESTLYLSNNNGNVNGGLELVTLNQRSGTQIFNVQSGINSTQYRYAEIWCKQYGVYYGSADLGN